LAAGFDFVAESAFLDVWELWAPGAVSNASSGASSLDSSVAAVSVVGDGAKTLEFTHPVFPEAESTICNQPESRDATRALAPA
jgi:hypothetical protein